MQFIIIVIWYSPWLRELLLPSAPQLLVRLLLGFDANYKKFIGYFRRSGPGGPSACRLARSTKAEDKDSPHGDQTEALPDGRPPLPSGEEPPATPLEGRRWRHPLSRLHIARAMVLIPHRRWEWTSRKQRRARGTKGMVKARVAPVVELLEDVVRAPRPASLKAMSWRHPLAINHFLEGVQEWFPRWAPDKHCPRWIARQGVAGHQARSFPFVGKEEKKASPSYGEGSLQAKDSTSRSCPSLPHHPR
jgi:hypothetical protein